MNKQPKLVLRESCVHDLSHDWAPGRFVEMGAGTGHMASLFLARGFRGACHDLGADSRAMIRRRFAAAGEAIRVVDTVSELNDAEFDYLLAFEVLEHLEDHLGILRQWVQKLRPGGRVLVSVPAHAGKFGRSDQLVGHMRRYERAQLHRLLEAAGIGAIRIVNYGFPITELTRRLSNWMVRNDSSYEHLDAEQRSIRSAQGKPRAIDRALCVVSGNVVRPFCVIQRWFYRYDLGDGLVASGVRVSA
ncbi:MAG: class I SAM-dependent methyltransferase [Nitrococcus mobilis]|nr:class I SAM-dependent methyltransferase [Nitrococcus mobilis]